MVRKLARTASAFRISCLLARQEELDAAGKTIAGMIEAMDAPTSLMRTARIVAGDADLDDALSSLGCALPLLVPLSGGVQKKKRTDAGRGCPPQRALLGSFFPNDDILRVEGAG